MFNEKKLFSNTCLQLQVCLTLVNLTGLVFYRDKELIFYSNIALLPIFRDKFFFSNRRLGDIINFDKGF